ncbi:MAG TPA: AbrB/MazE/SpoVT family DNA-binding domain-containing protein [Candidatus Lokiarchaeia archaeon]|nr:AbrB/MazE/SpoVT family DNA-binding domain-containing protein [Candidatus Lokiarchaeia archaeon]
MNNAGSYKITRQGQITIPSEARKLLNLEEGDIVDMFFNNEIIVIKKRKTPAVVLEELATKTSARFKKLGITRETISEEIEAERQGR